MTLWSRVRDGVLALRHQLGRQVALVLWAAVAGRHVYVVGSWGAIFDAVGLARPSDKAGRAALGLLARAGAGVRKVGHGLWELVVDAVEEVVGPVQLELAFGGGPNGQAESDRPAESLDLERLPAPADPEAARVQQRVLELGAVEDRRAYAVTLTAATPAEAQRAAEVFVEALGGSGPGSRSGCWLVPEIGERIDHLHWHGIAVGSRAHVAYAWERSGAGSSRISEIRDERRLRWWLGYATKAPAGAELASGVLAEERNDERGERRDRGDGQVRGGDEAVDAARRVLGGARASARRAIGAAWRWLRGPRGRCPSTHRGLQCELNERHREDHEAWNADDGYRRVWPRERKGWW